MKLLRKEISGKDSAGSITLLPLEVEDLWQLFNIIVVGDVVKCSTYRKVVSEKSTSVVSQKVRINLSLEVTSIDFDPNPAEASIRISGKNVGQNKYVKMGAFHTSTLEVNRQVSIQKSSWDYVTLQRVKDACDPRNTAKIAAVVMQQGLANVCLVTSNLTLVRSKIEKSFPKKKSKVAQKAFKESKSKFYKSVFEAMIRHIDLDKVKVVLLASPGFTKDEFFKFMLEEAQKILNSNRIGRSNVKSDQSETDRTKQCATITSREGQKKFMLVHSSTGQKQALDEVLADPSVARKLESVSAMKEVTAMRKFMELFSKSPNRVVYSLKHVELALDQNAVETLLISDSLFRSTDLHQRRLYVNLVENCREQRHIEVLIFSSMHVTGKQLDQMTGIAAILRYAMNDIEFESEEQHKASQASTTENEQSYDKDLDIFF